jgi:hypothetical protein
MGGMAGVVWPNGKAYFFSGDQYIRYDIAADRAEDGYPKDIASAWPGVFARDIDAVLVWPDGKAYFFSGDQYIRYDVAKDQADAGYPKPVKGNWPGLAFNGIGKGGPQPAAAGLTAVEKPGGGRIKDKSEPPVADQVTVTGHGGGKHVLHRLAAESWSRLVEAARADGIGAPLLEVVSGYRSIATQEKLWQQALAKYGSEAEARKYVAKPGGSAHHSGRAIDCWLGSGPNSENVPAQRKTQAWAWLTANAERFGFYPYEVEPWHWEYNPPAQ